MKSDYSMTSNQVMWLLATMNFGTTVLLSFTGTITIAGQDAWISVILSGAGSLFQAFVALRLASLFPNKTLSEFSQILLGKWGGYMITLVYMVMLLLMIPFVLRQGADFVTIAVLQDTPISVVSGLICLPCLYLVMFGLKSLVRCSEVIGPIVYALVLLLLIVLVKDVNLHNLRPIYADTGAANIMRGSLGMMSYLCESVLLLLLPPFMSDSVKAKRRGFILGILIAWLFLSLFLLFVLMIFGPDLSSKMWYPAYGAVRFISFGGFIERVDPIGVLIWMYCMVIKLSLFILMAAYNLSKWLQLKKWKSSVLIIVVAGYIGSLVPHNIINMQKYFPERIWLPWIFPINLVLIPLLLWMSSIIRRCRIPDTGRQ
ncbi:endospore germination permease [Paenibacillus sp. MWE-103]|uniref:Endospore germination permease n=1 Tax=Paenibacillus artemisiicola TaxID=1172618 RepID=A0ABS3W4B3_9BACL|nr:endospore germination permease [Paenibacillus artemisiicola]MBO7743153.1 endospore germination permease [Paenibacillus artemisiicola]